MQVIKETNIKIILDSKLTPKKEKQKRMQFLFFSWSGFYETFDIYDKIFFFFKLQFMRHFYFAKKQLRTQLAQFKMTVFRRPSGQLIFPQRFVFHSLLSTPPVLLPKLPTSHSAPTFVTMTTALASTTTPPASPPPLLIHPSAYRWRLFFLMELE